MKNEEGTTNTLCTLCDSGAAESLISKKFTKELKVMKEKKENWSTALGTFKLKEKLKLNLNYPN